jgi:hypothetical protein
MRNIVSDPKDYNINTLSDFSSIHIDETSPTNVTNIYWYTNHSVLQKVVNYCQMNQCKDILEIGPGTTPFPLAKKFIGKDEKVANYTEVDINKEVLPETYDFIYARHVLEDIHNPEFAMREMILKSKSGFIETPSPLIEIMRNIDAERNSNLNELRGYAHHRYIVWSNMATNTIYFLPKLPLVEKLEIPDILLKKCCSIANDYPVYWNNYFLWDKKRGEPTIVFYGNREYPFDIIKDYGTLITKALQESIENTNYFVSTF